jgi:sodium pump decarboxylase gamma subunit
MTNLEWGVQMTVLGMGLVFGLLVLLWGLLHLVLRFDREPADAAAGETPTEEPEHVASGSDDTTGAQVPAVPTVNGLDADLVAAIAVATLTHEAVRRREAAPVMRSYWPGSLLYASRWVASGRMRQNATWQRRGR